MIRGFLVFVFLFLTVSASFVKAQQDDTATTTIARAVVHLVVTTPSGESREGSGVLVSPSGAIFTARHVVEDAAEIRVEIFDSLEVPPIFTYYARIQYISQLDNFDFAIIEVFSDAQGQPLETTTLNIPYIQEWGDSVVVREPIEIVGYLESANGVLHFTSGIVGSIQLQPIGSTVPEQRHNFYQTDAVFGSGDSGGLVINSEGEFIGIPTDWESDGGGYVATILPISTICQIEPIACEYRSTSSTQSPSPTSSFFSGENLVANSGFEEGIYTYWQASLAYNAPGYNSPTSICSTQAQQDDFVWIGVQQDITVEPNASYDFSAWLYWENATQVHAKVVWLDYLGQQVGETSDRQVFILPGTDGSSGGWTLVQGIVTAPNFAQAARISFWHGVKNAVTVIPGGMLCVDDVQFTPLTLP